METLLRMIGITGFAVRSMAGYGVRPGPYDIGGKSIRLIGNTGFTIKIHGVRAERERFVEAGEADMLQSRNCIAEIEKI